MFHEILTMFEKAVSVLRTVEQIPFETGDRRCAERWLEVQKQAVSAIMGDFWTP